MNQKSKNLRQRFQPLVIVIVLAVGMALGAWLFGGEEAVHPNPVHAAATSKKAEVWTCSMHPQIRKSEPGKCPICGMDLIPVKNDQESTATNQVVLSERAKALVKLRTSAVSRLAGGEQGSGELQLLGKVEPNEKTLRTVTAWTGGRIDRLHVRTTGERIRAGQTIATLYSPEVFAAHQDLIVAKKQVQRLSSAIPGAQEAAQQALSASRERLKLLGVPESDIKKMENQTSPTRSIAIRSPFSGTVMERVATEGAYVSTGAPLYKIANLSTLWVQLDAYESDLPKLRVGQKARIKVEALAPMTFEGELTFIDPTLDSEKRTAKVRVEVKNPDGQLRPGMFAEAIVAIGPKLDGSGQLSVPASAVLFTGRRSVVYVEVELQNNTVAYEPRTVRLGPREGDSYPVVAGLSAGERVVTRGAFALDADLQIHGGPSMMSLPDDTQRGEWDTVIQLDAKSRAKLKPIVEHYLELQKALAADQLAPAQKAAQGLVSAVSKISFKEARVQAAWAKLETQFSAHGKHVVNATSLEYARTGFEQLSKALEVLMQRFGNPTDEELFVAHCPMAFGSKGASWVQDEAQIDNSYFGESMRTCGEVTSTVRSGAYLPTAGENASKPPSAVHGGHQH